METIPGAGSSDPGRSPARSLRALGSFEVPVGPTFAWLGRNRIAVILALGTLLRLAQYLTDRPLWLDEMSLRGNITSKTLAGLFGPLSNTQLAPPGFLVVEWLGCRLLGDGSLVLRLFPLACGIAALFLFHRVALRCVSSPRAVEIALVLFAVSDDLIYYASELKQYSSDVAVALVCDLQAMALAGQAATRARLARFAAVGALAVWFSHPSAFVLAGLGTVLILSALRQRQWRTVVGLGLMCLAWVGSFAAVYLVAQEQLGHRGDMWRFWDFAFPPMPPRSLADAAWGPRRVLYLFVNPLDFHAPLRPALSFLPALGFFVAGCVSMAGQRTRRLLFGMLAAPLGFVLVASSLHLYPFHGRLVLFLVPSLLLVIAEGAARVGEAAGRRAVWAAIVVVLLLYPSMRAAYQVFEPHAVRYGNPYGDLRPTGLDPSRFPF